MIILTAMRREYQLARRVFGDEHEIRNIGVGPRNAIRAAKRLMDEKVPCNTEVMMFGFVGSNVLPKGTHVYANLSSFHNPVAKYEHGVDGLPLSRPNLEGAPTEGYPCFTSADFVTATNIRSPAIFDMELAFFAELWPHVTCWGIVSDNLNGEEFEEFVSQLMLR